MSKKIANFGGVGGQYSPNSPGGSPMYNGGTSGGSGFGVNDFSSDTSLDSLMSRSHKPNILGFERPFETMLETFHTDLENDVRAYILTFDERQKLSLKQKIRGKEQHLKDLAEEAGAKDKLDQIKKKMKTVEGLLDEFRKNDNIDFTKNASYYRRKNSPPLLDEFLPTEEEYNDEGNPLNMTKNILTEPWTGITPHYTPEDGVDKYVEQLNDPHLIDMHAYFDGLMTAPQEGNNYQSFDPLFPEQEGSPVTPEAKNNSQPLEKKLQKMKEGPPQIGRLDPNMFYGLDWDSKLKGRYPERGVVNESPWSNSGLGDNSTTDYPDTSNNPYFSVMQ